MKKTDRIIALALCCTLTLGAFAYRPQQAKAIAGVDDAVVIGALLTAFAGGMGLIFSNNGMTGAQIAEGMAQKWEEYKETLSNPPAHFSEWLGYEDNDALMMDMVLQDQVLALPRAVAKKFAEFTKWLIQDLGVTSDQYTPALTSDILAFASGTQTDRFDSLHISSDGFTCRLSGATGFRYASVYLQPLKFSVPVSGLFSLDTSSMVIPSGQRKLYVYELGGTDSTLLSPNNSGLYSFVAGNFYSLEIQILNVGTDDSLQTFRVLPFFKLGDAVYNVFQIPDLSVSRDDAKEVPDIDDEKDTPVGVTGVGWDASTIEELLQQILAQVEANTLAPTLEGVDTDTGGDTGTDTDEDAKPYLPYIPRIFEKIGELPNLIAEKIGAFFTTLWGWLSNIIDAIKAIPSAVAEAVGALFKPDEALVTEITDTFKEKFGFLPALKRFGDDLFGMTAETEPPIVWIHLENAESKYGYIYGDKTKALDLTWYQKYKANVDTIVSGFLWLAFLWLLFKRASSIIQGGEMIEQYTTDISAGHREKGGKKK